MRWLSTVCRYTRPCDCLRQRGAKRIGRLLNGRLVAARRRDQQNCPRRRALHLDRLRWRITSRSCVTAGLGGETTVGWSTHPPEPTPRCRIARGFGGVQIDIGSGRPYHRRAASRTCRSGCLINQRVDRVPLCVGHAGMAFAADREAVPQCVQLGDRF